jgi:hypothetical protein
MLVGFWRVIWAKPARTRAVIFGAANLRHEDSFMESIESLKLNSFWLSINTQKSSSQIPYGQV